MRRKLRLPRLLALHQQSGECAAIPALTLDSDNVDALAGIVEPWARKHRPEVIITAENAVPILQQLLGKKIGSSIDICLLDHPGTGRWMGVEQFPFLIGETAIDLLAGQVQRGELGFEEHPRITMVDGAWRPKSGR